MKIHNKLLLAITSSCVLMSAVGLKLIHADADPAAPDGSVLINNLSVPLSSLLSAEGRAYMLHLIRDKPFRGGPSEREDLKGFRAHQDQIMDGFLEPIRKRYPVDIQPKMIAGIYTDVVTPKDGISRRNQRNVLINLHGGGFVSGARTAALVESVPIAALEKIRVISVDYRMYPESRFPAASEDVEAVYKEVLKEYAPQHIGIYGCSAGGMLAGMSVAWFQKHGLPRPAAVGVLCASLGDMFAGDSAHLAGALNGMTMPPRNENHPAAAPPRGGFGYLSEADLKDPLVFPIESSEVMAKFPPTLLVTSTRGFEFSSVVNTHNALVRAGVEAELHVWDGLPHAFWYNSDLPESREAYDVIAHFFDRHLAGSN